MDQVHVIGMRFQISADFHADIELVTGIDTKVWDLNGPHLEKISMQGQQDDMVVTAQTHEEAYFDCCGRGSAGFLSGGDETDCERS